MKLQILLLALLPLASLAFNFGDNVVFDGPINDSEKSRFMGLFSLCGEDDSLEAKCYATSEPEAYKTSKAVLRIVRSSGSGHCTGWFVGNKGHIMTNYHCIGSQSEADDLKFQAMSESDSCEESCKVNGGCAGETIHSEPVEFIASGGSIADDYTLVKLKDTEKVAELIAEYGYLKIRKTGAVVGERVYVPQHPAGWAKRIAMKAGSEDATIISTSTSSSCGSNQIAYKADTQGGSSGSPVISYDDNTVVAIHHCGGCTTTGNTGVNGDKMHAKFSALLAGADAFA